MKYNAFIFLFMAKRMKAGLKYFYPEKQLDQWIREAKPIYKQLLSEVHGVSDRNPMASNITMSFVVIAIWLASNRTISPEEMSEAMIIAVDIKPLKLIYGMIDMNTARGIKTFGNMMHKSASWAKTHPEDDNTWVFHFDDNLHEDGFYYSFSHCPIASFCSEHGYEDINPVLCNIDFTTMSMMHSVLHRDHTIAEGGGICDYWTVGNKIKDPR